MNESRTRKSPRTTRAVPTNLSHVMSRTDGLTCHWETHHGMTPAKNPGPMKRNMIVPMLALTLFMGRSVSSWLPSLCDGAGPVMRSIVLDRLEQGPQRVGHAG